MSYVKKWGALREGEHRTTGTSLLCKMAALIG